MNAPIKPACNRSPSRIRSCSASSATWTAHGSAPTRARRSRSITCNGRHDRQRARDGRRRSEARDRGRRPRLARLARQDRQGARAAAAQMVRPDDGEQDDLGLLLTTEQGKPLAEAKGEIAYAPRSSNGSPRGQASLRRRDPGSTSPTSGSWSQAADRRRRDDHAVEFPERDDHAQGRAGAGRRSPWCSARRGDPFSGACARRTRRASRHSEGVFNVITGGFEGDRRRAVREPGGAQALVHGLDRNRARADAPVGRHG